MMQRVDIAKKSDRLAVLVIEFVIYSFIGWGYETILTSAVWGKFAERGFLRLPLCPIYGFCSIFLLLIFGRMKNILLMFVLGMAVITTLELAASYFLELFTEEKLWDYYSWKFNFDGRIALGSSLIFGAMCVFLVRVLRPSIRKLTDKISGKKLKITAATMMAVILTDLTLILLGV